MKALVIKIRDAGVFKNPRTSKSQDKMVDINGKVSRFDKRSQACTPYLKVPAGKLSIGHVANLLRVLWGERPIPHLRKVHEVFTGNPYFEDLAKKVRTRIDSVILPADKIHKDPFYPEETTTIRKSIGDSWQTATRTYLLDGAPVQIKGGLLYPDRLRRYIGDVLFDQFNKLVFHFGGATTIQKGIELLNVNKVDDAIIAFCTACVRQKRTSLSNIILNQGAESVTVHASPSQPLNLLMACGNIDTIEKFSATLYVPITDEDLKRIEDSTGVATFLEGGFATITGVEDWSEMLEIDTELTVEGELCT
jgi:hypothetical protein